MLDTFGSHKTRNNIKPQHIKKKRTVLHIPSINHKKQISPDKKRRHPSIYFFISNPITEAAIKIQVVFFFNMKHDLENSHLLPCNRIWNILNK
jgi:hypothetical protein